MTAPTTLVVLDLPGVLVLGLSGATLAVARRALDAGLGAVAAVALVLGLRRLGVWRDRHAPVAPQWRAGRG